MHTSNNPATLHKPDPPVNEPQSSTSSQLWSNILPDGSSGPPAMAATAELQPKTLGGPQPVTAQLKDPEVKDYGWNVPPYQVPAPVMNGISNDDLYTLLRRFNKVRKFDSQLSHLHPAVFAANIPCQSYL